MPVQQKQPADAHVKRTLDSQVLHAAGDDRRLLCMDENAHERGSKQPHQRRDHHTEAAAQGKALLHALANAPHIPGAVILGHKGGVGIAEVLHRQIGKAVDLHRRREGRHHRGAKAIHQPLHHENAKVHHRLLRTGEGGQIADLPQHGPVKVQLLLSGQQRTAAPADVQPNADCRGILRQNGGGRRPADAPAQNRHEQQVQPDVQQRRYRQKHQRNGGIAQSPQQAGAEIVDRCGHQPQKNDGKIGANAVPHRARHPQKVQNPINSKANGHVQHHRHRQNQHKRVQNGAFQLLRIALALIDGKQRPGAHAQPKKN